MNSQTIALNAGIETSTPNQRPKGETQMNRINSVIGKLASIAAKASLLVIVVVGSLAASPMAFAQQCWYSWSPNPVFVTPGSSVNNGAGTLQVTMPGIYLETFTQSGNFSVQNLQVGYNGNYVPASGLIDIPQYLINLSFSGIVPSTATNGQTADVTMKLYDLLGNLLCYTTVAVQVVTSPGLSTEMNTIGGHNEVDEYYKGTDLHVYKLSWTCGWTYTDITAAAGAPNVDYLSTVVSQVDPQYNRSEVFYLDSSGNVEELYNVGSTWHVTNLTNLIRVQPAGVGSPLVSLVNPYASTIQLDYIDSAGHIHEMWSGNRTSWYGGDLTAATGAPPAATMTQLNYGLNSSLVTEVNKVANTVEIYFLGTDNHVRELWFSPLTWQWYSSDPTAAAGAPNAAIGSGLVSLSNPIANTVQVDYLDSVGHIHELWWNGTWHTDDLTASTGAPIAARGSSLATEVNTSSSPNTVELYYIANNQTVQELWFNPTPWVWNYANPSGSAGAPHAAVGSPLVSLVNTIANSVQVHYISTDDHVHELYTWNWTTWYTDDVNQSSGDPNNAEP